ncbi:MAG: DUF262 domain-containing protein [Polyangiaceae bacterium]
MAVDTSQKTESIDQLVSSIEAGDVVLPEFQRDFVWEQIKTYELFDSLIRDIFIGSLIFGVPTFELTVRELDLRPRKGRGSRAKLELRSYTKSEINQRVKTGQFRLLLDGQQRATSLYRAMKGTDEVWVILRNDEDLPKEVQAKQLADRTIEDVLFEVAGSESPDRISIRISDCFKMLRGEIVREKSKAELFEASQYGATLGENFESAFDAYLHFSTQLQNLFRAEKLLSYYLLDTDEEKFSLFFERSNSRGIQLNFIDILAAKLYAGFNLRSKAEEFEEEFPTYGLGRNELVRAVAYVTSDGRDIGRQYILSTLSQSHFNEHWDSLGVLYRKAFDYLFDNHLLVARPWLPYENLLIPLMMFLRELPKQDFSQLTPLQKRFLTYWYWSTIFSQRYSSASQEIVLLDARALRGIARGEVAIGRDYLGKFAYQVTEPADLLSISKKYNAIYRGVLNLVHWKAGGVTDWSSNSRINYRDGNLDDHHIFPRKYLASLPDTRGVDCVLNRALIPKLTNIQIGKKRPGQYFGELKSRNPELEDALAQHLIPAAIVDGSYDDLFEIFLEDRGEKVVRILDDDVKALRRSLEAELFGGVEEQTTPH